MRPDDLVDALRVDLPNSLIALDFDGTLAPIVPDPMQSRPVPGTAEALTALAGGGAQVALITGRDATTVLELSGLGTVPGLIVEGLYGAETWHAGELTSPATPDAMESLRAQLPAVVARGDDEQVWIEDKRLSLVVHGRLAADPEAALDPLREPVAALAAGLGVEVHAGRGVIELRLPGFDKAGALRRVVEQVRPATVLFAGDDVGDLPAFAAVRHLRAGGARAWSIGVLSPEVPELGEAADVHVDSPADLVRLLAAISGDHDAAGGR